MPYLSEEQRSKLDPRLAKECEDMLECMDMWGEVTWGVVEDVFEQALYETAKKRENRNEENREAV